MPDGGAGSTCRAFGVFLLRERNENAAALSSFLPVPVEG
jgi:hypothetical protein